MKQATKEQMKALEDADITTNGKIYWRNQLDPKSWAPKMQKTNPDAIDDETEHYFLVWRG